MTERNPIMVILLAIVSCGLYSLYYLMVTTQELMTATGRTDINPTTELLINVVTCGMFGIYIAYRNQQIIDEQYKARGVAHDEKAMIVVLLAAGTYFFGGWPGLVAAYIYQDELNKFGQMGGGAAPGAGAPMTF